MNDSKSKLATRSNVHIIIIKVLVVKSKIKDSSDNDNK